MVAMLVRIASPAAARTSVRRFGPGMVPGSAGITDHDGMRPRPAPCRTVGSIPTSVATPAIAKAATCASRSRKHVTRRCRRAGI
jgi:hypothetical protein